MVSPILSKEEKKAEYNKMYYQKNKTAMNISNNKARRKRLGRDKPKIYINCVHCNKKLYKRNLEKHQKTKTCLFLKNRRQQNVTICKF